MANAGKPKTPSTAQKCRLGSSLRVKTWIGQQAKISFAAPLPHTTSCSWCGCCLCFRQSNNWTSAM